MKRYLATILLCAASTAQAHPFHDGDAQAGKALFDKYKCNRCHMQMVGGDGSAIFTREDHKVHSEAELIAQIRVCSGNVGATLSAQEEQHLGAYLNRYYKLK